MADPFETQMARVQSDPRRQWGWGPSALASPEEKDAWRVSQGQAPRDIRNDPTYREWAYTEGGYPKSRRQIRMQEEWEKRQAEQLNQQRIMQQMDMEQKNYDLRLQSEQRLQDQQRLGQFREEEVQNQARRAMESVIGATLPDGQRTRPINVNDENAVERLQSVIYSNPLGMENQATKEAVTMMLNDALSIRERRNQELADAAKADAQAKVGLAKDLGAYGLSIADFTKDGKIDFVAANEAVGKAYAAGEEAKVGLAETKEERKNIAEKITSAEKELLKVRARVAAAQKRVEARPTVADFKTEFEAATIEQGILEDEINRLNRLRGGEAAPQPQQGTTGQRPPLSDIFGGSR